MKSKAARLFSQSWFIFLSGLGGLLFTMFGLSIGWMIGSLIVACLLTYFQPKTLGINEKSKLGKNWFQLAQFLLGIELGKNLNLSVMNVLYDHWLIVAIVLLFSIIFSFGTGFLLYRFSKTDLLTSFLATSPGGVASMPVIAEEVGANIGIVSAVQAIRVFFVVSIIPVILFLMVPQSGQQPVASIENVGNDQFVQVAANFSTFTIIWTVCGLVFAFFGVLVGKRIKLPAPWLLGTLLGVLLLETISPMFFNEHVVIWWPHFLVIFGQILIGASIGAKFRKSMFVGIKQIVIVGTIGTILLIAAMFLCAYIVSAITGIQFIASVLAFAPGGVVEMATVSMILDSESTFVVAVQTLRIILVILFVPLFIKFMNEKLRKKNDLMKSNRISS
ncbi:AbrB family transcriptional regulator [Calidifontibacillus erzurumensis]|uniref:AbrB family transcriptional regulator n=1 Tax=Calidifontibacillus erzurumensis TaxID=2741433 RepID=A0A8J8GI97_9BACI|nr:AbrB family transcriptional regulator [Calidifontibacillus erzurumensis]NSL52246.1 AbrB family transcriptional regulator [Calidifontibacillus erzurumensis]